MSSCRGIGDHRRRQSSPVEGVSIQLLAGKNVACRTLTVDRAFVGRNEIVEIVAEEHDNSVILGDGFAARSLVGAPAVLLALQENRVEIFFERKPQIYQVFAGTFFERSGAIRDVEDGHPLVGGSMQKLG